MKCWVVRPKAGTRVHFTDPREAYEFALEQIELVGYVSMWCRQVCWAELRAMPSQFPRPAPQEIEPQESER